MSDPSKKTDENKNVFFITSNQTFINKDLVYSVVKRDGIYNCKQLLDFPYKYNNRENFTIKIHSFQFIQKNLSNQFIDKKSKKYKAIIELKQGSLTFKAEIQFLTIRNNFIYDLRFSPNEWFGSQPPISLYLKDIEQFNYYVQLLKEMKLKQDSDLYNDLSLNTHFNYIIDKKYYLNLYLEIFKNCYKAKSIQSLLLGFKPERVMLPTSFNIKSYSSLLNAIAKDPPKILFREKEKEKKNENDKKKKTINKCFFTLLLYFKMHYERKTLEELIKKKENEDYFWEILINYKDYFKDINISDNLLNKMLNNNKLDVKIITAALSYIHSFEKILLFINNNRESISKIYIQNKEFIIISNFVTPKETDDLTNINYQLNEIIKYQKENGIFIKIEEELWRIFIQFSEKKDYKKLILIKKAIEMYSKIDTKIHIENFMLEYTIHQTGIEQINKGELKNNDLLEFIEKDIYFKDNNNKNNKVYRPLSILDGIDIENIDENFYEKWNDLKMFDIFKIHQKGLSINLIKKINNIKYFHKIFKLHNLDNNNDDFCDESLSLLLSKQFGNLLTTYKEKDCPNFIKEASFLIYLLDKKDKKNNNQKKFMKDVIEKSSINKEIIFNIYINLSSKYKISDIVTNCISDYFKKNKKFLNVENWIYILKNINSEKIKKSIFDEIKDLVINENDIFNEEKETNSIKMLRSLQGQLKDELNKYNYTNYFISTKEFKDKFYNNIIKGDIKYNVIIPWWKNIEKKKILINRFEILFFEEKNKIDNCKESITKYYKQILLILNNVNDFSEVFKKFYYTSKTENLKKLEDIKKEIINGSLNIINPESLSFLNEINRNIPDIEKKKKLKDSVFFVKLFNAKMEKSREKIIEDVFKQTEKDFQKLKILFEDEWINKIDHEIINECYKGIKEVTEYGIIVQLNFIKTYLNLENIQESKIKKIKEELIIFSKKNDIYSTINSLLYFIEELNSEKTDFSIKLEEMKEDLENQNLSIVRVKEYFKYLEEKGIKILNQTDHDKDLINILNMLYNTRGSLEFILTNIDYRHLQEIANNLDNCFITGEELHVASKCSDFMEKYSKLRNDISDIDLIALLRDDIINSKNIAVFFDIYTKNYTQIKDIYLENLDKSEATRIKIKNISKESHFCLRIIFDREDFFSFEGYYFSDNSNNKKENNKEKQSQIDITLDELDELRGRALLGKKLGAEKSKEEKEIFELNQKFSERVNEINKIKLILNKIALKGYSEDITISIDIIDSNPYYGYNLNDFKDCKECIKYLNDILQLTIKTQISFYKKSEIVRYIYGRKFNILKKFFRNKEEKSLEPFLKYISNDMVSFLDSDKYTEINEKDFDKNDYKLFLENCNIFISNFLKKNGISFEMILEQNKIKQKYNNEFIGIYTYLLENDESGEVQRGLEEHILNWYHFLTDHPPMAQTLLLCNYETTSEEITAFLYRAFLCKYHIVYMIGNIELLSSKKTQTLTDIINKLYIGHEKEMKSCLVFAYIDKTADIVKYLESMKSNKILEHKDKKKNEEILYDENVEIISSDKSGVGKSTQIKLEIDKKKKKYIHFPFGGVFNRKDVINRLKEIKIEDKNIKNTVIHLDLYDTNQIQLMKDFLYSFLITKLYGNNETLFYLSKEIEIKIEIPCGFIDFFLKFPILNMFKNKKKMTINKLPPLIVSEKINSNIQIVCNYLKLLKEKKLDSNDLFIENISADALNSYPTKIIATALPQEECQQLVKEYMKIEKPNYYQINSFINILSGQLKKFSLNVFFSAGDLIHNGNYLKQNLKKLRVTMVESFIKNTEHFTRGAFDKLLNSQIKTFNTFKDRIKGGIYDEDQDNLDAIKVLCQREETISFNKIKPSLIFFHEGQGQGFSIISTCEKNEEEYKDLLQLRNSQIIISNYFKNLENMKSDELYNELNDYYNKFEQKDFLKEIKEILSINLPLDKEELKRIKKEKNKELNEINEENENNKTIEEIVGEYAFTADNFIKMILILLRIRENVPVIMMGETGCGKTSLIRKLSELINKGKDELKILNIHAGTTDKEIHDFLYIKKNPKEMSIIEEAELLQEVEKLEKQNYEEKHLIYYEKKIWIFLDEINTCNCMGLICELMTKHSCQGKKLPENIVFIGACNPYRIDFNKEQNGLKIKDVKEKKLAYTVNPLPHALLNYVFNFGSLNKEDEKKYINNMVKKKFFENKEKDNNKNSFNELINLTINSIADAQNYVRDKNDVSSVSLREIRRFTIFYDFYCFYFKLKNLIFSEEKKNGKKIKDFDIYKYAINLSLYICYYLRLIKKKDRKELSQIISKNFGFNFEENPKEEQIFIANNIKMKEGIAKNTALLENLFSIFSCVNAKIPLFIVGKPGCSKSLSVQLIFDSMKGENSDNNLFKKLAKLYSYSFQGSLTSTSEGVLKIFKKSREILKRKQDNLSKIISMVYFDEMGLAEHSINNPLKVIHSELEYDLNENDKKVAFVGISNWRLDASKMNRGIYLSIPQPDLNDLKKTAEIISESYDEHNAKINKDLFENLAITYYEYKNELNKKTELQDFHGTRDFYHLIKNASRIINTKKLNQQDLVIDEQTKKMTGINCIERNFAGLEFNKQKTSLEVIKEIFKTKYEEVPVTKEYDVLQKIRENINDKDSRYLLLISKSSTSYYLLMSILNEENKNKNYSFHIGSRFKQDCSSEEYTLKILNKVQLQMEQNKVLVLSDLESVYPNLYDLFNQNFLVVSEKNYARIAIGGTNNTFSFVNDGFKCIVLVDQSLIKYEDAPFLNRFEKHIISFEYLLKDDLPEIVDEIYQIIQNITKNHLIEEEKVKFKLSYNLKSLLINCGQDSKDEDGKEREDKEEIQGIIYRKYCEIKKNKQRNANRQELQDYVLENIALTFPQDIILFMNYSGFRQKYHNIYEKIINNYKKGEHRNLTYFLESMENIKNIIYTFSSIEEPILPKNDQIINTKMFGKIKKENISETMISSLHSENELEEELEDFYLNPSKKIFVFKFTPIETDMMNYLQFFIQNQFIEKYSGEIINGDNNYYKRAFIFSVHLNRIFDKDKADPKKENFIKRNTLGELISHLSDFYQIFIDNLNGEDFDLIEIMELKNDVLFKKLLNLNINKEFRTNIYNAISYFDYRFNIETPYLNENNYSKLLIEYLKKESGLTEKIINCILKQPIEEKDIFSDVLKNNYLTPKDVDLISVTKRYLSEIFTDVLTKFVFKSEQDHFLSTFLYNKIFFYKDIDDIPLNEEKEIINNKNNDISDDEIEEELNLYPEEDLDNKSNNNKNNFDGYENNDNINIDKDKRYYLGNKLVEKLIDFYLEKFDTSNVKKFSRQIKNNFIKISQGLKLPGIKSILYNLRTYIKSELKIKYLEIENEIRNLSGDEKIIYPKEFPEKRKKLKAYENRLETEINKTEVFSCLNKLGNDYPNDCKQFYEWLLEDYFMLYLSDTFENIKNEFWKLDKYKNFLRKMVFLRFNISGNDYIQCTSFAKKILWLESNKDYIDIILDIYKKLLINEENLLSKIDYIIEHQEIQYEISERSLQLTEEYNSAFFLIMESLLKIIISDYEMYQKIKEKDFPKFMSSLKIIFQNAFKIEDNLNVFSKEIWNIQELLIIYEKLNNLDKGTKENLLKTLQILSHHSKLINNLMKNNGDNYCNDLCINIQNLYDFLIQELGDTDNFAELMMNICVDEAKKTKNKDYRKKLTEIILNNPKLTKISYPYFYIIINYEINYCIADDNTSIKENITNLKNSNSITQLNIVNNDILDEVILSIFECFVSNYFKSLSELNDQEQEEQLQLNFRKYYIYKNTKDNKETNEAFFLLDYSLGLFTDCLNYLEEIFNNNIKKGHKSNDNNEHICTLYCIAFIKMYLFKCIYYIHKYNQQFSNFDDIVRVIIGSGSNKFREIIKIYVFKIFFYLSNNNYYNFSNYYYNNKGITFYEELQDKFNENKEAMLNYYFMPLDDNKYEKYSSLFTIFENDKINSFSNPIKEIKENIEKNGLDIFFAVSTNIIISNICMKNYLNSEEYKNYCSFAKNVFSQLNLPTVTKNLFFLFSKEEEFNNIIKLKLLEKEEIMDEEEQEEEKKEIKNIKNKISPIILETILHSLRLCLKISSINNNKEGFYSQLLSSKCKDILVNNYIPGDNLINNIYINNYQKIIEHLNTQPSDRGIYVCSCGLSYIIESCGFPCPPENEENDEFLCKNCKKQIGYAPPPKGVKKVIHGMVMRKGHYRIFKDENQKKFEMELYGDSDKNINNILLKDYYSKIIEPILDNNKNKYDIHVIPKKYYQQVNLKVRKLSQIGFRLLHFVLYSHLFFLNCLGYLSEEELKKKYLCDGMTCVEMIMTNWDILKENLEIKYGIVIQIFMNLIFDKLTEKLKSCKLIKTNVERDNFENEIETIVREVIDTYPENSKKYIERNIKDLQLNKDSMKSLMLENFDMNLYDEIEYPFYKYFSMTTYPSESKLVEELHKIPEYENKYPLLNSYLNIIKEKINDENNIIKKEQINEIEFIKYLPKFNEFSNIMIDIYSYKISRNDASSLKISKEDMYKNNQAGLKDNFNSFIKIWNKIGPYVKKYENEILSPITLDNDKSLDYFLIDCEEKGKGRYIAGAYEKFIEWQNNFLNGLIEPLRESPYLNHFIKNIEKKIDIQKATNAETLNFDSIDNFNNIIYENCKRNIFIKDNKTNYINYKKLVYNFDSIEKDLGKKLLPNKKRFNHNFKFVTYCFEAFKGNKNSILIDFEKCYDQKKLELFDKQKIYDYIIGLIRDNNNAFNKILFSIQRLFYYLTIERKDAKELITDVIKDMPDYVNLHNEGIEFFEKFNNIKIEGLLNTYLFIEVVSFKYILNNLKEKYKATIDKIIIDDIKQKFNESKFSVISRVCLCSACRKVITRLLMDEVEDIEGNEKNLLTPYLDREDLWDKEIWKKTELFKKDLKILRELKINIGQCYELYMFMKEKEDIELNGIELDKNDNDMIKDSMSRLTIMPKKWGKNKKY